MQGLLGSFVKFYEYSEMQPEQYIRKGVEHVFVYDHDFRCSINPRKPEFYDFFRKAYDNYIEGDWLNANHNLSVA